MSPGHPLPAGGNCVLCSGCWSTASSALLMGTLEAVPAEKAKEKVSVAERGGSGTGTALGSPGCPEGRRAAVQGAPGERCKGEAVSGGAGARPKASSRGWFRSIDLWVMGPARSRCATLLPPAALQGPPQLCLMLPGPASTSAAAQASCPPLPCTHHQAAPSSPCKPQCPRTRAGKRKGLALSFSPLRQPLLYIQTGGPDAGEQLHGEGSGGSV